jgi:hypothetical protein
LVDAIEVGILDWALLKFFMNHQFIFLTVPSKYPSEGICVSLPERGYWPESIGPKIGDIVKIKTVFRTGDWDFLELEDYQEINNDFFCERRVYNRIHFEPVFSTEQLEDMLS